MYCTPFRKYLLLDISLYPVEMFRYHEDGSKKLDACNRFFLCMVYFEPKHKISLSQIIYYSVYTWDMACIHPAPCFLLPALFTCHPFSVTRFFLLSWRTSFLARGANVQTLLSLVCYHLPTLCCFSHPNTPHRSS